MVANVTSCTLDGIDAVVVDVECEITKGLPTYNVVGLAATSVKEGTTRIRSALESVGSDLPLGRIVVNLAPADLRKPGSALDLPIAASVLLAYRDFPEDDDDDRPPPPRFSPHNILENLLVLGELGLDGTVRRVHGVLAAALLARERGMRGVVVPEVCAAEALVVDDLEVYVVAHLRELMHALAGTSILRMASPEHARRRVAPRPVDMAEVRGQLFARSALELAVAGGHNLLLAGPPGTGKTMLARRVPTILPPLTRAEALATTKIYSALGLADGLVEERPFRAPHHTISAAALLGGGSPPRPGEISLAHNGVLFLDELPEFSRAAVEGLREPLEDRSVTITRVSGSLTLPASFLMIASANPCPCGYHNTRIKECTCNPTMLSRYGARLSGPLMDRIDLQAFVPPVDLAELRAKAPGESSASIRDRVMEARERQRARLAPWGLHCNAEMTTTIMRATCKLDSSTEAALKKIVEARQPFSARSVDRLLKVARTVADLLGQEHIDEAALDEASRYRDVDPVAELAPPKTKKRRGKSAEQILADDVAKHGNAEEAVLSVQSTRNDVVSTTGPASRNRRRANAATPVLTSVPDDAPPGQPAGTAPLGEPSIAAPRISLVDASHHYEQPVPPEEPRTSETP